MQTRTGPQIGPVFIDCCDECGGKGCLVRKRKRRKDARAGHQWLEDVAPQSAIELMWSTPLYRFLIVDGSRFRKLFETVVEINMLEGVA